MTDELSLVPIFMATWPLILALIAVLSFSVYVFIKAPVTYLIRWTLIPIAFASTLVVCWLFYLLMGFGVPTTLPTRFIVLGYHVNVEANKKSTIDVWIIEGKTTRLYSIPHTKSMEKSFEQAMGKKQKGGYVVMEKSKKRSKGNGTDKGDELQDPYQSNIILPHMINPKDQDDIQPEQKLLPEQDDQSNPFEHPERPELPEFELIPHKQLS